MVWTILAEANTFARRISLSENILIKHCGIVVGAAESRITQAQRKPPHLELFKQFRIVGPFIRWIFFSKLLSMVSLLKKLNFMMGNNSPRKELSIDI